MRLATTAFLILLGALIGLADLGRQPAPVLAVYRFPGGDDLGHFGLAALGAFLLERAVRGDARLAARIPAGAAALAFALALTLEELSQLWNVHRVCDPRDLAATWVGIAFGLAWAGRHRSSSSVGPKRISPR